VMHRIHAREQIASGRRWEEADMKVTYVAKRGHVFARTPEVTMNTPIVAGLPSLDWARCCARIGAHP
jgi:hypothetical protein